MPPPAPYGAPAGQWPPPYATAPRRGLPVGAIVAICVLGSLVVLGILSAIAIPVFLQQRSTPRMPQSLAGQQVSTDPALQATRDAVLSQMTKVNPTARIRIEAFGDRRLGYLAVTTDTPIDAATELRAMRAAPPFHLGEIVCGTDETGTVACVRTGTRGAVEVLQVSDSGLAGDVAAVAASTEVLWRAQPFS
jgi:hypothetical protein